MASPKECGVTFFQTDAQIAGSGSKATGYLTCSVADCPLSVDYKYISDYTEGLTSANSVKLPKAGVDEKARQLIGDECMVINNEILPNSLKKPSPDPITILKS